MSPNRILELLNNQEALIKVVNNNYWNKFIQKIQSSENLCLTTSTSLLPPGGRHMKLFSQVERACGGIVWDISRRFSIQNKQYYAWPSGYYAKTEYNLVSTPLYMNARSE